MHNSGTGVIEFSSMSTTTVVSGILPHHIYQEAPGATLVQADAGKWEREDESEEGE